MRSIEEVNVTYLHPFDSMWITALVQQINKGLNGTLGQKVAYVCPRLVSGQAILRLVFFVLILQPCSRGATTRKRRKMTSSNDCGGAHRHPFGRKRKRKRIGTCLNRKTVRKNKKHFAANAAGKHAGQTLIFGIVEDKIVDCYFSESQHLKLTDMWIGVGWGHDAKENPAFRGVSKIRSFEN
jgi:hypothetical protein